MWLDVAVFFGWLGVNVVLHKKQVSYVTTFFFKFSRFLCTSKCGQTATWWYYTFWYWRAKRAEFPHVITETKTLDIPWVCCSSSRSSCSIIVASNNRHNGNTKWLISHLWIVHMQISQKVKGLFLIWEYPNFEWSL